MAYALSHSSRIYWRCSCWIWPSQVSSDFRYRQRCCFPCAPESKLLIWPVCLFFIWSHFNLSQTAFNLSPYLMSTDHSSKHGQPLSIVLTDFYSLLASFATTPHPFLITGDFNIHVDDTTDNHALAFSKLLSDANLIQHVTYPTHIHQHTSDVVITPSDCVCTPKIRTLGLSPSDHSTVITALDLTSAEHPSCQRHRFFRRLCAINICKFTSDLSESNLIRNPPNDVTDLVECFTSTLSNLLDKHGPLITEKSRTQNPSQSWYTPVLRNLKSFCRKAERVWKRTRHFAD